MRSQAVHTVVILVAATNDIDDLRPLVPALRLVLADLSPGSIRRVK